MKLDLTALPWAASQLETTSEASQGVDEDMYGCNARPIHRVSGRFQVSVAALHYA